MKRAFLILLALLLCAPAFAEEFVNGRERVVARDVEADTGVFGSVTVGTTGKISEETNTMTFDDGDGAPITLQEIRTAAAGADDMGDVDTLAELNTAIADATLLDDGAIADSTAIGLDTGATYTNYGAAGDDSLNELFAALDTAIGTAGFDNLTDFDAQTAWRIFYSNADGDTTELALGADGEYLKSNGASAAPTWATPSGAAHDAVTLAADADVLLGLSTQAINLDTQTANYIFAGPASGAAADPTFRAMDDADIPAAIARDTELHAAATISATANGLSIDAQAISMAAATDSVVGTVELSNDAESVTGTSDVVVVTPGTLTARLEAPGAIGGTTPAAGKFTALTETAPASLELTEDTSISEAQLQANKFITNQGASAEVDLTLPAVSYRISRTFIVEEAQIIELNPPTDELFDLDGTGLDANDCVDSPATVGSKIVATRHKDASGAWVWGLDTVRGTWADTGESD